ncbi:MAG: lipoyl(octanoyl) transferase, partial [Dehalococcoidia bacterium]|nr:lipoyl(octanoyl) transferase [Dehalococcoidia bacterium]
MQEDLLCRFESGSCWVLNLGAIDYLTALDLQNDLVRCRIEGQIADTLLLLEHHPVITLGAYRGEKSMLVSKEELARRGISVVRTDRGGDITYHGPGQLVVYPILGLKERGRDVHRYVAVL